MPKSKNTTQIMLQIAVRCFKLLVAIYQGYIRTNRSDKGTAEGESVFDALVSHYSPTDMFKKGAYMTVIVNRKLQHVCRTTPLRMRYMPKWGLYVRRCRAVLVSRVLLKYID
jgi:hypothetical protein